MARKVAPTKVTGGGGFAFEDKVATYFLFCLLTSRSPLDPSLGTISRIDFQTRADGWLLDDILLTLTSQGEKLHCAFSVKSNQQFTENAAPSDFVKLAWEQFLPAVDAPFDKAHDRLGLITTPLTQKTSTKLNDLLKKARLQDPKDLAARIHRQGSVSKEERRLFASFACPLELAEEHNITELNTGELLRCIEHLDFDFERANSTKLNEAIIGLRDILLDGSQEEGLTLWKSLCSIAGELRPHGGYIDLIKLLDRLRHQFRIKDHPDHKADWIKLLNKTKDSLMLIQSKIGGRVYLSRDNEQAQLDKALSDSNVIVILGPSGCGKTVITKSWVEKHLDSNKVLWLDAGSFKDFDAFEDKLHLHYQLRELMSGVPDKIAYIVIDGLDRIFSEAAFKALSLIIQFCRLVSEISPWKILASCQPEEWGRIQIQLSHVNLITSGWKSVEVKEPTYEELGPVWEAFPALRPLNLQSHLKTLLFKPKILDLIATKLSTGASLDTTEWVGESDLIDWFWGTEVAKPPEGLIRASFLKLLAQKQADDLAFETPSSDFSIAELRSVQNLLQDRILKQHDERVSFHHDLYGDWARQRVLLEKSDALNEYLKNKLSSPLWCRALRLYGLHLLEKENDLSKWRSVVNTFSGGEEENKLAQDLLIESVIFASNPFPILERLWPDLTANNGILLRRLLGRFLHSATLPNPLFLAFARTEEPESSTQAATIQRVPYWPYWLPILNYLHDHMGDVINLVSSQVALIADKWLRYAKKDWPMRKEAAELGINVAERMLAFKMSKGMNIVNDKVDEMAFRAGLAACNECSNRVIDFALTACARKDPSGPVLERIIEQNQELEERKREVRKDRTNLARKPAFPVMHSLYVEEEPPPPWPDGPNRRVDSAFQNICLNTDALHPFILSNPSIAREIILALLIEHPTPRHPYRDDSLLREDVGLAYIHGWFPPFYTRGSFFSFLHSHPNEGLKLILRLVNFATERWAKRWVEHNQEPPNITINFPDGDKQFLGDNQVHYWFRDIGRVPDIIPSALMALEKWFYDQLEKDESKELLTEAIEMIIKEAHSLAFIGLLFAVGKKKPSLFLSQLQPFLSVPEFYSWDVEHIISGESHQMIGWSYWHGKLMIELAQEWNSLPHRKIEIAAISQHLFLNSPQTRPFFEKAKDNWESRLKNGKFAPVSPVYLENLVAWFDISNWRKEESPEGEELWKFEMPLHIAKKREAGSKELKERQLLIHLPIQFRQILDSGKPLPSEGIEQLWDILQRVTKFALPVDDDPDADVLKVENVICGGVAVLLQLHRDWLKQYPGKEKWCIEQLVNIIHNPPKNKEYDSEVSIANWHWGRFCAHAIPILWAEQPDSFLLRECVVILAASPHYETVNILFKSASRYRATLGDNFKQLQHFLLRWADARWKHSRDRYKEKPSFNVKAWLRREVDAFAKGAISSEIPTWRTMSKKEHEKSHHTIFRGPKGRILKKRRYKQSPDLNFWLIKVAHDWIPPLDQAISEAERAEWIAFWKEALGWTLRMLGESMEEDEEISGTPTEWDRWVFERIASLITQLKATENPEEFWKPILDLGSPGHYWIDDFLTQWFLNGLRSDPAPATFITQWQAMLDFAFNSPKWNAGTGKRGFYFEEIWWCLMGFNWISVNMWVASHKPLVRQMRDAYERWANEHLINSRTAIRFIEFLRQPAAQEILFDSLIWLDEATRKANKYFWHDRDNLQDRLASLLDMCWHSYQQELRQHENSFRAFKNLLKKLVDFQNLLALEIQQRLVNGVRHA
jgi:hypothetical protein